MAKRLKATYLDGHEQTTNVTLFDTTQAEKYLRAQGDGTMNEAQVEGMAYATYFALRRAHKLEDGQSFDQWMQQVDSLDIIVEPSAEETEPGLSQAGRTAVTAS